MVVLIGYVPTPEGEAALDVGLAEAKLRNAEAVILNSPRTGALMDPAVASPEQVEALLQRAAEAGIRATVRQPVHNGDLADEFVEVADEVDAELVVIGLRRRSQVGTFIAGRSAQRILLQLDRPVLTVKAFDAP